MKIKQLKIWKENLKLKRPYTIAYKTVTDVESAFLMLEAENGVYGIGAANPSKQVVGKDVEETIVDLEAIADQIKGLEFNALPAVLKKIKEISSYSVGAMTALDIAAHDLFCKYYQIPIADYYGRHFDSMPTSITVGIMDVTETMETAAEYVAMEFDHLKVKLGQNLEEDIERLAKLREKYGNSVNIRVDANLGYSIDQMHQLYEKTKAFNLELIEQPVPVEEALKLESLNPEIKKLIAADESLTDSKDALSLIEGSSACGIFNIKLMKCGGIRESKVIGEIGELKGLDLMWGCNDESIISITAALHSALSCPNTKYLDLDGSLDLAKDVVSGGFKIEKGRMYLLDEPGLGVKML